MPVLRHDAYPRNTGGSVRDTVRRKNAAPVSGAASAGVCGGKAVQAACGCAGVPGGRRGASAHPFAVQKRGVLLIHHLNVVQYPFLEKFQQFQRDGYSA
ncbi:hypothetical protein RDSD_000380 [Oleidesulfovibrio alaskensis]